MFGECDWLLVMQCVECNILIGSVEKEHSLNPITVLYRVPSWAMRALEIKRTFLKHALSNMSIVCE